MDIRKRFTLSAVAIAILALNSQTASARVSCPTIISGIFPAVCEFDVGSSVTVANGGSVQGISMSSYHPSSSFITVDAGGSINATNVGIHLSDSSLSNGILNNGTITSATGVGILIDSASVVSGGITNNGTIATQINALTIDTLSTVNGDIVNTGTIASTAGTGIRIISTSTLNGNISNSGIISAGGVDNGIVLVGHSTINGSINNNGAILATGSGNGILVNNGTISGDIINNGSISSNLQTGISLNNLSTLHGNISNNGTITGGSNAIAIHNGSIIDGGIFNTGTVSGNAAGLTVYSSTTVSGGINNSGTISSSGSGIAINSNSTISGGITNSGTIRGDLYAVRIISSNVDNFNIVGQHARIIGFTDIPDTDFNITSGAVFSSEGEFLVKHFNIAANAVFNMSNSITALNVNNAGTLAIGNNTQTITGEYTQNVGGMFQVGVTSSSSHGALAVTGTVDLSQSGNLNVQVTANSALRPGDVITNVLSGSVLQTPTDGYQVTDNSFIWRFRAANNLANNGVNLVVDVDPEASNACMGSYCQGAATVVIGQVVAGNPAFGAFATLPSLSAFQTAVSQVTPELTNETVQTLLTSTTAVMDIVPMWGVLRGQSAGDAMMANAGKLWMKPYGVTINQNAMNTIPGYSATDIGLVVGTDLQLTGDWMFGGAFALGKNNMRGKAQLSGQTMNSDVYQAVLYGARQLPHNLYLAGQALVGYGKNDSDRTIPLYASSASASFNSWFTNVRAQLGWNIDVCKNFVFTPELDASYLYLYQNGYHESGSPMDLIVAANNNTSFVLGAYANAAYHLNEINRLRYLTVNAYAGVARNVLNAQPQTTATFVAGGPAFSTFGIQFNNTVFRGGVGLTMENPTKPLRVNVNYDAQIGNNAYSGIGSVTLSYKL